MLWRIGMVGIARLDASLSNGSHETRAASQSFDAAFKAA